MARMLWLLTSACVALVGLGCQTFSDSETFSFHDEKPSHKKPTELIAFWQDGLDTQLDPRQGGQAVPGFSGRVIFHHQVTGTRAQTVAVDGTLLVQLYEDKPYSGPVKPLETWTILPEHLPMLMKRDLSGWGYALWLPWTSCNQNIQSGRLIVKFTGKDGSELQGEPMPVQMNNGRQGGIPRPQLSVERFPVNTWEAHGKSNR